MNEHEKAIHQDKALDSFLQTFFDYGTWKNQQSIDQLAQDLEQLSRLSTLDTLDAMQRQDPKLGFLLSSNDKTRIAARIESQLSVIQGPLPVVIRPLSDDEADNWQPVHSSPLET